MLQVADNESGSTMPPRNRRHGSGLRTFASVPR